MSAVIFLDVDGVLNRCGQSGQGLESDKVSILKYILDETSALVVLSSTWRKTEHNLARISRMLGSIGHQLHDVTPILDARAGGSVIWTAVKRCTEIADWLDDHPEVTKFAILDDDWDAGDLPELKCNFFHTESFLSQAQPLASKIVTHLKRAISELQPKD